MSQQAPERVQTITILHRGREIVLAPGRFTIGRSATCHIVVDGPLISRQHAEVIVAEGKASLRDLGSVNGVYVNGSRIGTVAELKHRDCIAIGGHEFEVSIGIEAGAPPRVRLTSQPPGRVRRGIPEVADATTFAEPLELASIVAGRALAAGRTQHAANMLRSPLRRVIETLEQGGPISDTCVQLALDYSLRLAVATRNSEWIDCAFRLLETRRPAASRAVIEHLRAAIQADLRVDVGRLDRYAKFVRAQRPTPEQMRISQELDDLVRTLLARNG